MSNIGYFHKNAAVDPLDFFAETSFKFASVEDMSKIIIKDNHYS